MSKINSKSSITPLSKPIFKKKKSLTHFITLNNKTCEVTDFRKRVYGVLKKYVSAGKFTTYDSLVKLCGGSSQSIGTSMKCNPFAPIVPCHRVLRSDYSIGGFMGATDVNHPNIIKKIKMLKDEGLEFDHNNYLKEKFRSNLVTFADKEKYPIDDTSIKL